MCGFDLAGDSSATLSGLDGGEALGCTQCNASWIAIVSDPAAITKASALTPLGSWVVIHDDTPALVGSLIRLVEFNGGLGDRRVTGRSGTGARAGALLAALNAHAFAVAEASVPLWVDEVLQVAARPLARVLYETGVLAQWVARDPGAAQAIVALHCENRRKLDDSFAKAPRLAHVAADVAASRLEVTSPLLGVASSFKNVCDRFDDGGELYAHYRLLCGHTHVGVEIADQWIADDEELAFRVLEAPRPQNSALLALGVMGLLMTASAFEEAVEPGEVDVVAFLDGISEEVSVRRSLALRERKSCTKN